MNPSIAKAPFARGPANRGQAARGQAARGPANVGPANVGPANRGPANVGPANLGPANLGPAQGRRRLAEQDPCPDPASFQASLVMTKNEVIALASWLDLLGSDRRGAPPDGPLLGGSPLDGSHVDDRLVTEEVGAVIEWLEARLAGIHEAGLPLPPERLPLEPLPLEPLRAVSS